MKKRSILFLCACALLLSTAAFAQETAPEAQPAPAAEALTLTATASPFARSRSYAGFSDVAADAWYEPSVAALYEFGLTEGVGGGRYAPDASVTLAELAAFSARLNAAYTGAVLPAAAAGEAWYQPYVAYLKGAGLLGDAFDGQFERAATRAEMAGILAFSLPSEWYDERNASVVTGGYARREYITDVNDYTPYQPQILWLYKQGVVGGTDASGTFLPDTPLRRSEVAALLVRMIDPDARLTLAWQSLPYRSAAGTTLASLITAPASVSTSPASSDAAAIDALVRQALATGSTTVTLRYPLALGADETAKLTRAFTAAIKRYCEQMYNSVTCRAYSSGRVELTFSSTVRSGAALETLRTETAAAAAAVHDALWESGYLDASMDQYQLARAYYIWLCSSCVYDSGTVGADSMSHLAYSALVDGVAVCDGYTGAYDLLLRLEGIDCYALFNDDHIWTVATLDGKTYHIDTTWGDQGARADLSFFGMTEAQSRAKHAW